MQTLRLLLVAALALVSSPTRAQTEPALVIERGGVARSQLVALGRDLEVHGEAWSDAVAINGSIWVTGRVAGDLIVLGGDVLLSDGARVEGDVFVLGGRIQAESGAHIQGRSVAYPSVGAAWLTLVEGPSLGLSAFSPVVIGAKLALLASWLALGLFLFAVSGRGLLSTSKAVRQEPFRNFFVGLTGVLALLLTAVLLSAFSPSVMGIPLLMLIVLTAVLLKLWGMVAVFHALGHWVATHVLKMRLLSLNAAALGVVLLGVVKMLPWVGTWAWTVASLIAVGASLSSKFGRYEPWFAPDTGFVRSESSAL